MHLKLGDKPYRRLVNNLNKAGLNKLWLGFDNWMPAFYQPNAVELAKQSGC